MSTEKLIVQRTLQSLVKYASFMVVIMMVVFACSDSDEEDITITEEPTGNLTATIDGAIMGSVIAPNAKIEIIASNSDEKITGSTDGNGEFFINGFEEGTYTVIIKTEDATKQEVFENVEVVIREVTALGTIDLAVQ